MERRFLVMLLITFFSILIIGFTASQLVYAPDGEELPKDVLEQPRFALMQSYNSQTITHVGYVVAFGVALATLFSRWNGIWDFFIINLKRLILLFFILSLILSLTLYSLLRTVFYASLSSDILVITETDIQGIEENTTISKMQNAATEKFLNRSTSFLENPLFSSAQLVYRIGFERSIIVLFVIFFSLMFLGYKAMKWAELKLRDLFCRREANAHPQRYFGKH